MSHTYHKLWLHFIWSTKNHNPLIIKNLQIKLNKHIKENAKDKDIYVDTVNGVADHIHLLVGLYPKQSPSYVANMIKGESSNWINKNDFISDKFAWQNGFSVFSVSESIVPKVREYIKNQEEHHKKMTYEEEVKKLLKVHGIMKDK